MRIVCAFQDHALSAAGHARQPLRRQHGAGLYNCILGAKPIEKDGHGFYYSDYNNDGSKVYHPYKWHCCTGTFSQVAADYGISLISTTAKAIYVNLYVPSRVKWTRGQQRVTLTQHTQLSAPAIPTRNHRIGSPSQFVPDLSAHSRLGRAQRQRIAINGKHVDHRPRARASSPSLDRDMEERRPHRDRVRHADSARGRRPAAPEPDGRRAWTAWLFLHVGEIPEQA